MKKNKNNGYFGDNTEEWSWKDFQSTEGFKVTDDLLSWVIGQDKALEECKLCIGEWIQKLLHLKNKQWWKAFEDQEADKPPPKEWLPSGPFLLMIGDAGTGKSLIGRALSTYMTDLYKKEGVELNDVLSWKNKTMPSNPKISIHPSGIGKKIVQKLRIKSLKKSRFTKWGFRLLEGLMFGFGALIIGFLSYYLLKNWLFPNPHIFYNDYGFQIFVEEITKEATKGLQSFASYWASRGGFIGYIINGIMANAMMFYLGIGALSMGAMLFIFKHIIGSLGGSKKGIGGAESIDSPKLLIDNSSGRAPFIDATGHGSSQLFGSIAWNPYQCCPKSQYIITNKGIKFLEECKVGEKVLGNDGKWKNITDFYETDHIGKIVCVKGVGVPLFKGTKCHPIFVLDGDDIPIQKLATHLDGDERLLFPKIQMEKDVEWITKETAYLLGQWVANGYNLDGKQVRISLGDYRVKQIVLIRQILHELNLSFGEEHYNNSTRFLIYSAKLVRRIESLFGKNKTAKTKEIPIEIILLPREKALMFIKGYIDGDGNKGKNITTSSASDKLSRGFQFMLVKNNIWGNYRIQPQKGKSPRYEIQITPKYASRIYPEIYLFDASKSHPKVIEKTKWFEIPIRKIWTEEYNGRIFDVTSEDGCFSAPFLVHNTGGLGTPEHQRVSAGDVHRAHLGVLYIDEIKNLKGAEATTLLTVLEDGQLPIALRSQFHGGDTAAMAVSTEPVPCMNFFIAAGNLDSVPLIHYALMDRIYGYGKVVYMNNDMDNSVENRRKYVQFISQEIKRFNLLPFSREACIELIKESSRKSDMTSKLSTKFRPMISIIKTASIIAFNEGKKTVEEEHVKEAIKEHCRTIQLQVLEQITEKRKIYQDINPEGKPIKGQIYGLAVSSFGGANKIGMVLPIKASVEKLSKNSTGYFRVTGVNTEVDSWVQSSISKVTTIIQQRYKHKKKLGIHIDFAQSIGVNGPSAGVAMVLSLISLFEKKPIRQDTAVTGEINISVEDKILITPIGGVREKILGAQEAGFKRVLIPKRNYEVNVNQSDYKIKVVPCETLSDYEREILVKK